MSYKVSDYTIVIALVCYEVKATVVEAKHERRDADGL